jgi:uncharacterized protein
MAETPIHTVDELVALVGTPLRRVAAKTRAALHDLDRQWLAASPFCLVATADENGACDVSPNGDPPGAARARDRRHHDRHRGASGQPTGRRIPQRAGQPARRTDLSAPGRGDRLRVNGRRLVSDAPFFDDMVVKGHRPILALVVEIEEIFHHCAKAFLRSPLWQPETWTDHVPGRPVIARTHQTPHWCPH